jgi:hypothetical protein
MFIQIDVQIATYHLLDHIEWDLLSPLTPEAFASQLCMELGLSGEALPLIAHAIHEELIKHKKDAIEWGVIGGDKEAEGMKDKTGLGMGWGRTKGPKVLQSVWREWTEAEEFRTRFEILTAEEVERREIEKERASRCDDTLESDLVSLLGTDFLHYQAITSRDIQVPDYKDQTTISQSFWMHDHMEEQKYNVIPLLIAMNAYVVSMTSTGTSLSLSSFGGASSEIHEFCF